MITVGQLKKWLESVPDSYELRIDDSQIDEAWRDDNLMAYCITLKTGDL